MYPEAPLAGGGGKGTWTGDVNVNQVGNNPINWVGVGVWGQDIVLGNRGPSGRSLNGCGVARMVMEGWWWCGSQTKRKAGKIGGSHKQKGE